MTRTWLIVGAGGLACGAARVLQSAFPSGASRPRFVVVDDDVVDATNLHRQTLYTASDIGAAKAVLAARALGGEARRERFLPDNAAALLEGVDLVIEGADNYATKFLVADACALAGIACVHAGAVGWNGWVFGSRGHAANQPCLRCVFEDVPSGPVQTCENAGVVGPVVGVVGAVQGRDALSVRREPAHLWNYQGLRGSLRRTSVQPRPDCPHALGSIRALDPHRYVAPTIHDACN